jgi:hypothetical protein
MPVVSKMKLVAKSAAQRALQELSLRTGTRLSRPTSIHTALTCRCPLRCRMFDIWRRGDREKELSTEEWKGVLFDLRGTWSAFPTRPPLWSRAPYSVPQ